MEVSPLLSRFKSVSLNLCCMISPVNKLTCISLSWLSESIKNWSLSTYRSCLSTGFFKERRIYTELGELNEDEGSQFLKKQKSQRISKKLFFECIDSWSSSISASSISKWLLLLCTLFPAASLPKFLWFLSVPLPILWFVTLTSSNAFIKTFTEFLWALLFIVYLSTKATIHAYTTFSFITSMHMKMSLSKTEKTSS